MALIHHASAKRAATLGLTLTEEGQQVVVRFDDVVIAAAENGKAALQAAEEALEEAGYEDFADLADDLRDEQEAQAEDEAAEGEDAEDEDAEDEDAEEGEKDSGSIVKGEYRQRYAVIGIRGQDNGDDFAAAFIEACGEAKGEDLISALIAIATANGIDMSKWTGRNPGQQRMNLGNVLRGRVRRGEEVRIGGQVFLPSQETLEKIAAKSEARKGKAADRAEKAIAKAAAKAG